MSKNSSQSRREGFLLRTGQRTGHKQEQKVCAAHTPHGPCSASPVESKTRCRLHGGLSTGPRTAAGIQTLKTSVRAQRVSEALASGWLMAPESLRALIVALKERLNGSQNATVKVLGVTRHVVRRVLSRLPLRPEELEQLEQKLGGGQ